MEEVFVKPSTLLGEEIIQLSPVDLQSFRAYADFFLFFQLDKQAVVDDVVKRLIQGLGVALSETREVASTVRPVQGSKRKELELFLGPESGVRVRIVRHGASIMEAIGSQVALRDGVYPDFTKINFSDEAICGKLLFVPSVGCEDPCPQGLPAFLVQMNFLDGGLILSAAWHHSAIDAKGVSLFLDSWALHSKKLLTIGMPGPTEVTIDQPHERWRLGYGIPGATLAQFPAYEIDAVRRSPLTPNLPHLLDRPMPKVTGSVVTTWYFSAESLQSLRSMLAEGETKDGSQFTQSEAVTALIWKHLSQARQLYERMPEDASLLTSPVDFRSRVKGLFHNQYVGNVVCPSFGVRTPLSEVCAPSTPESLARLAGIVRDAILALDEKSMREFIGLLATLPADTDLVLVRNAFPGPDLRVTDLAGVDASAQDWGEPLGSPVCVRCGGLSRGIVHYLPKDKLGGFEIQFRIDPDVLGRLQRDEIFTRFAEVRC